MFIKRGIIKSTGAYLSDFANVPAQTAPQLLSLSPSSSHNLMAPCSGMYPLPDLVGY